VGTAKLRQARTEAVDGEVRFDARSRGAYAQDGSNYPMPPIGVVVPRNAAPAVAITTCSEFKVVHPYRLDENLTVRGWSPPEPRTLFQYPHDDGKFSGAVSRCVGVGKCRGDEGGVTCPSYRVTREEEHSARGRARPLMKWCAAKW
jgi:hypothetical protein